CLDRTQPLLHNTLTEGHTWRNNGAVRSQVEARAQIIKEFMPEVYAWIMKNLDRGVEKGWLKE
ncbi:MAG: hydrolase, partial [Clostridiales bacterium]|nr:hydrolase [Clostridiales bacterium]